MFRKRFYFSFPALRVESRGLSSAPPSSPPPRLPLPPAVHLCPHHHSAQSVPAFLGTRICLKAVGSRSPCQEERTCWGSLSPGGVPWCRHSPVPRLSARVSGSAGRVHCRARRRGRGVPAVRFNAAAPAAARASLRGVPPTPLSPRCPAPAPWVSPDRLWG